jgi:hypothetical protein
LDFAERLPVENRSEADSNFQQWPFDPESGGP